MYTLQDEIDMEGKIELLPCQKEIERVPDEDMGVNFVCRTAQAAPAV